MKGTKVHALVACAILIAASSSLFGQPTGRRGGGLIKQPPQAPQLEPQVNQNAEYGTVAGTISWSKALGLPPMYPGASEPYAVPCGLFVVLAKKTVGASGSFGQYEVVGRGDAKPENDRSNRRNHACTYTVAGLPKDTSLLMTVEFIDTRTFDTTPWLSVYSVDGLSAPPSGSVRVFTGGGGVMLTNDQPNGRIDFSIGYARAADMPR